MESGFARQFTGNESKRGRSGRIGTGSIEKFWEKATKLDEIQATFLAVVQIV